MNNKKYTQGRHKYQIDTLLWSKTTSEEGDLVINENGELSQDNTHEVEKDEYEHITFEVYADSEQQAWAVGGDYMIDNYNQELYDADTTITEVAYCTRD